MSLGRRVECWVEGIVRIVIGIGLVWIGVVEGAGYGMMLKIVGVIFILAGVAEIYFVERAARPFTVEGVMKGTRPAPLLCELPVFYATTEGQTRRIAEALAVRLRERGLESRAIDLTTSDAAHVDWSRVRAAVVGASLHVRHHQHDAEVFVRQHACELNRQPSAFFSVSLSTASQHAEEKHAARQIAETFPAALGWHPNTVVCLAGRLAYTRYGILTRFVLKQIARRQGAPTDTSRDYEFTNWDDVTALADDIAGTLSTPKARVVA